MVSGFLRNVTTGTVGADIIRPCSGMFQISSLYRRIQNNDSIFENIMPEQGGHKARPYIVDWKTAVCGRMISAPTRGQVLLLCYETVKGGADAPLFCCLESGFEHP